MNFLAPGGSRRLRRWPRCRRWCCSISSSSSGDRCRSPRRCSGAKRCRTCRSTRPSRSCGATCCFSCNCWCCCWPSSRLPSRCGRAAGRRAAQDPAHRCLGFNGDERRRQVPPRHRQGAGPSGDRQSSCGRSRHGDHVRRPCPRPVRHHRRQAQIAPRRQRSEPVRRVGPIDRGDAAGGGARPRRSARSAAPRATIRSKIPTTCC